MKITAQKVVSMHYTLKNDAGTILDSSDGQVPLVYMQGSGQIIPGLERELESLQPGDRKDVVVSPQEAYGLRDENYLDNVPLSHFPDASLVKVGAQFHAGTSQGERICTVVGIDETGVTLDFNHPLAGQTLYFSIEIMDVREATADELAHGHAHGPHCQHGH